jgi:hypothetical protein
MRNNGKDGGGMKSQGMMMKSVLIRLAKCVRIADVPCSVSETSSTPCISTRNDAKEDELESLSI